MATSIHDTKVKAILCLRKAKEDLSWIPQLEQINEFCSNGTYFGQPVSVFDWEIPVYL